MGELFFWATAASESSRTKVAFKHGVHGRQVPLPAPVQSCSAQQHAHVLMLRLFTLSHPHAWVA
eukprot:scaffold8431_cov115-Isochrysis_galbana.AAC.2